MKLTFLIFASMIILVGCQRHAIRLSEYNAQDYQVVMPPNTYLAFSIECKDSVVEIYDDSTNGDASVRNELVGFNEDINGYLIKRTFYEGQDYLLYVKQYCQKHILFDSVYVNPNKTRFASIGYDNAAGYSSNGVQIFDIYKNGWVEKIIEDNLHVYGPKYAKWQSDSVLIVSLYNLSDSLAGKRTYSYHDGTWTIQNNLGKETEE